MSAMVAILCPRIATSYHGADQVNQKRIPNIHMVRSEKGEVNVHVNM